MFLVFDLKTISFLRESQAKQKFQGKQRYQKLKMHLSYGENQDRWNEPGIIISTSKLKRRVVHVSANKEQAKTASSQRENL